VNQRECLADAEYLCVVVSDDFLVVDGRSLRLHVCFG
jgi:hypothetical protein